MCIAIKGAILILTDSDEYLCPLLTQRPLTNAPQLGTFYGIDVVFKTTCFQNYMYTTRLAFHP